MGLFDRARSVIKDLRDEEPDPPKAEEAAQAKAKTEERYVWELSEQKSRREPEAVPAIEKIEIFRLSVFEDCQHIANTLKSGNAAIVDYYYTLESIAKRIQHFMSGFAYSSEGSEVKVSENIFLYTPRHRGVQNNAKEVELDKTLLMPWKG